MSSYDSTIASYDNQIYRNNQRITECNQAIHKLEADIEELKAVRIKVLDVDNAVESAANNTSNKISTLPQVITNPFSILKLNFFSNFSDIVKGMNRTRARRGIENAICKIDEKIRELQREIESLRGEIRQCNENISITSQQRSHYIATISVQKQETPSEQTVTNNIQKTTVPKSKGKSTSKSKKR